MEKLDACLQQSRLGEYRMNRRSFLIAAASSAVLSQLRSTLRAGETERNENDASSGLIHSQEMTDFLLKHKIFREWYAIAEAVEGLSIRDNEQETTICVPPVTLTPAMIAKLREDYIDADHLVSEDGSFTERMHLAIPAVRGRVILTRKNLDVQMLVSLERTVNLSIDGDNDVVGVGIYQERPTTVPFGILGFDATGRCTGTADSNSNNIATLDLRGIDYKLPLQVKFKPHTKQPDTKSSRYRGVSPYDNETLG